MGDLENNTVINQIVYLVKLVFKHQKQTTNTPKAGKTQQNGYI